MAAEDSPHRLLNKNEKPREKPYLNAHALLQATREAARRAASLVARTNHNLELRDNQLHKIS
jgi:hypothetical protein